jgi:hypothetical protein
MSKRAKSLDATLLPVPIVAVAINRRGERKMKRKRLFDALLLVTVLGFTVQLMSSEAGAVNLQHPNTVIVMNDVQVLNATYPGLFNANYTYEEFATVNLATVPRPSGAFTFRDVIISYYFVYDENGIIWSYTQGRADEKVLVLMIYPPSTAPIPHYLQLTGRTDAIVGAKTNQGFAHALLFLMQPNV